jgi:hypothetical protein
MSLIAGDFKIVDPDGMENQMEVGKVVFTEEGNILAWSSKQFYLYDTEGTLLHRERVDPTIGKKVQSTQKFITVKFLEFD